MFSDDGLQLVVAKIEFEKTCESTLEGTLLRVSEAIEKKPSPSD